MNHQADTNKSGSSDASTPSWERAVQMALGAALLGYFVWKYDFYRVDIDSLSASDKIWLAAHYLLSTLLLCGRQATDFFKALVSLHRDIRGK